MVAVEDPVEDPAVVGAEDEVLPVVAAVSQGAVAVEDLEVGAEEVSAAAVEEVVAVVLEVSPEAVDVVSSRSPGIAMRKERRTKMVNLRRCDTTCVECALSVAVVSSTGGRKRQSSCKARTMGVYGQILLATVVLYGGIVVSCCVFRPSKSTHVARGVLLFILYFISGYLELKTASKGSCHFAQTA